MPSETMEMKRFSSSSFLSDDRQIGFWNVDARANHSVASPSWEKFTPKEGQIMNSWENSEPRMINRNAVGAERAMKRSSIMSSSPDLNTVQHMPYFAENSKIGLAGTRYENSLFSSSFSDLFSQELRSSLHNPYGQSDNEETIESTKEMEARTIGDLLPDDDDLLSGVTEGLEYVIQSNGGYDSEELDLFSSIGGMELGAESGYSQGMFNFNSRNARGFSPQSLPKHQSGLGNMSSSSAGRTGLGRASSNGHLVDFNEGVFGSPGNGSCPLPGHHYPFHYHAQPPPMWPNHPSPYITHHQQKPYRLPKPAPSHFLKPVLSADNLHAGSSPATNPSIWDRRYSYSGQSPGSLGSNNSLHSPELAARSWFPHGMDMAVPQAGLQRRHQSCGMFPGRSEMVQMANSGDLHSERARRRRSESGCNGAERKKQYELEIERIKLGEDNRTTLMIKNIPNKYTSKMLLAAIDERHRGTYDFLYLPIDFKNKCNVGYAFINMTDPAHIVPLYQAFNGKKWEKFNSEKVASIAYARIQGKAALISHFQNSSLMNEDKRCRPILFNTDGPNPGDQVPFPMGVNVRSRPGKIRSTTREESYRGSSPNRVNKEDFSNADSSSTSGRESD